MFCPGISGALISDLLHQQKIGLGIEDLETEICLRLTNYNTSLQAEIQAITDDLIWLSTKTKPTTINILRDSKLAIEAITANTIMLRTIINYITAFNSYSQMGWDTYHKCSTSQRTKFNEKLAKFAKFAKFFGDINLEYAKP